MKKYFLALVFVLVLPFMLSAKENNAIRYKRFAVGTYFSNSYATGNWANYVKTSLGGGITVEYTLPLKINSFDLGVSLKSEFDALIPVSNGVLGSAFDIVVLPGAFLRYPFDFNKVTFALVPEVSYGFVMHNLKGRDNSSVSGVYLDQMISISAGMRLTVSSIKKLEFEAAPLCLICLEKSNILIQPGYRIGALYHFTK